MSGGGKKNVKTTTQSTPPEYLQPGLEAAAGSALDQFNSGGGVNPFTSLDQQFGRASDLTQTRLSSEFSGAGRNLGASMPARSEELQTLASNIYNPQNLQQYDPTNQFISQLQRLLPGSGGSTESNQPYFKQGLF